MSFIKTIIFFYLFSLGIYPSDSFNSGIWFSNKKEFRNGFEFLQISLQKEKFILAKLSYNEDRKWEETRILGIVEDNGNGRIKLKPEMCTVYASKKLGNRWILIQGFDCDHFEIQMPIDGRQAFISPSIGITETLQLTQPQGKSENIIYAIVVSKEQTILHAWSLGMRYIRKNSNAFLNNKSIRILETVDSTGTFQSNEMFEPGDMIRINNRTQSDIFD